MKKKTTVYVASGNVIQVYSLTTGILINTLRFKKSSQKNERQKEMSIKQIL